MTANPNMHSDNELMLIAGQAGSKSTFAGGLYHHAQKQEDLNVTADVVYGDEEEFHEEILGRMLKRKEYPGQTKNPYIVEFTISGDSAWIPETSVGLMDIPGERQDSALQRFEDSDFDRDQVEVEYDEVIRDKVKQNRKLDPIEWETLYIYRILNSHKALFLLNLQKISSRDEGLIYSRGTVEQMLMHVEKCGICVTATDMLGISLDSETEDSESGLVTKTLETLGSMVTNPGFNERLYNQITDAIPHSASPAVHNLLNTTKQNREVDLLGAAVPMGRDQDHLINKGENFETQGFDEVIEWLN